MIDEKVSHRIDVTFAHPVHGECYAVASVPKHIKEPTHDDYKFHLIGVKGDPGIHRGEPGFEESAMHAAPEVEKEHRKNMKKSENMDISPALAALKVLKKIQELNKGESMGDNMGMDMAMKEKPKQISADKKQHSKGELDKCGEMTKDEPGMFMAEKEARKGKLKEFVKNKKEKRAESLKKKAPAGVDEDKYKRCKEEVEAKEGDKVNPFAVCAASLKKDY